MMETQGISTSLVGGLPPPLPSLYLAPGTEKAGSPTSRKRAKKIGVPSKKKNLSAVIPTKTSPQSDLLAKIQPHSTGNFNLNSALNHFLKEKGIDSKEKPAVIEAPLTVEKIAEKPVLTRSDSEQEVTQALQKIKKLNKQYQRRQKKQGKKENSDAESEESDGSARSSLDLSPSENIQSTEPTSQIPLPPPSSAHSHSFKINDLLNSSDQIPVQVSTIQNTPSEPLALSGVQTSKLPEDITKALSAVNHPTQKVQYKFENVKHIRSQSVPDLASYKGSILKQKRRTSFTEQEEEKKKRKVSFFFTGSQIFRHGEGEEENSQEHNITSEYNSNGEDGLRKLTELAEMERNLQQAAE